MIQELYKTVCELPSSKGVKRGATDTRYSRTDITLTALKGPGGVPVIQVTLASPTMPGGAVRFQANAHQLRALLRELRDAIPDGES